MAKIRAGLAAAEVDEVELGAIAEEVGWVHGREDLAPRRAAVGRPPHAVAKNAGVDRGGVRVVLESGDAALDPVDTAGRGRRVRGRLALQVSREGEGGAVPGG